MDDWVTGQRLRKWRLAGHTSRRMDGRWSTFMLDWCPSRGKRSRGHPDLRWNDDIREFVNSLGLSNDITWRDLADNREGWALLAHDFASMSTKIPA